MRRGVEEPEHQRAAADCTALNQAIGSTIMGSVAGGGVADEGLDDPTPALTEVQSALPRQGKHLGTHKGKEEEGGKANEGRDRLATPRAT